jgi:cytochrome c-type biogenesis protein CcmH/NrfF
VLATPPARGFNLLIYVLPPALVALGLAFLAYSLPKWRARARANAAQPYAHGDELSTDDAQRLDAELARFD